jgi:hypothetical protein
MICLYCIRIPSVGDIFWLFKTVSTLGIQSFCDLTKHMLVHTGVKPHECKTCGSRFTQKGSLVLHVKSVHQGLRQVCSECKKTFSDKSNLSKHVKTVHKKEKSHECSVCNKTFAHKSSLNHHKFICSNNWTDNHLHEALHRSPGSLQCHSSWAVFWHEHLILVHTALQLQLKNLASESHAHMLYSET